LHFLILIYSLGNIIKVLGKITTLSAVDKHRREVRDPMEGGFAVHGSMTIDQTTGSLFVTERNCIWQINQQGLVLFYFILFLFYFYFF
jgi:hypothetical protein